MSFNLHFQEIFFVSHYIVTSSKIVPFTFNLHFQEIFFVSQRYQVHSHVGVEAFQSPFSGDFLCFEGYEWRRSKGFARRLSISIFRRFSLFRLSFDNCEAIPLQLSISIFRRFSLFPLMGRWTNMACTESFQSPFSGDFLCFPMLSASTRSTSYLSFNLHFQEIFFVSQQNRQIRCGSKIAFNLHFQEIFFVSCPDGWCH